LINNLKEKIMSYIPSDDNEDYCDDYMTDVEADADTFKSCGWGTDEDYGYYGGDFDE
jgi:hypothetical protein